MVTAPLTASRIDNPSDELAGAITSWERSLRGRKSPATIRAYIGTARTMHAYLVRQGMPTDPSNMTGEHVGAFLEDQAERNSASTARLRHAYLSVFFRWLIEDGEIKSNPLARIKAHAVIQRDPADLDDESFARLLATTDGKGFGQRRDKAILLLLAETGLRRAECASIRIADMELDADPASVKVIGKGGKERIAFFGDETVRAIDRYVRLERVKHRLASGPYLWLGQSGPLSGDGIGDVVQRRATQAGLTGIHAHLLRHRWAHRAKARGMSDENMMAILGHSDRQMLDRYGRVNRARRAADEYKRLMLANG